MGRSHPRCEGTGKPCPTHRFGRGSCPDCGRIVGVHNNKLVEHWWASPRYEHNTARKKM